MGDKLTWKYRWTNPAWLWASFSPGWYERRAIPLKFSNDN